MALLADGLHMASHAAALSINACAYVYARRHAHDTCFSFGTGKVNALGGFTGAVLLVGFVLIMVGESIRRLIQPVEIAFDQAILVSVLGLIVNGVSVLILNDHHPHGYGEEGHHHHDHNLRSAYLHVLADALTSLLAILALMAGKYLGWNVMDPLMGIVGAGLILRWSLHLLRDTSKVLLDAQAPDDMLHAVRDAIENDSSSTLTDVHVWSIGPGIYAAALTVSTREIMTPEVFRNRIPSHLGIVHFNIEVNQVHPSA